ncbi:RNA polymerase sigma factor [Clostridiisalibacter paucivorans]|uniref:RNA polymerase sigma factor n=1 Tax=Clostridiisalibacter paucivorans TaxID=408753 RepID=UPI00047953D4|nr:sigma-70 family RNA polymerase sigma factor [Clostridiisalibacter paucivorans]
MVSDNELVKKILNGDKDAFKYIVDRYKAYIFAIILNFITDNAEAENVSQEVFLQAYRSLHRYRFENFKGWIGKIATHKALDYKKTSKIKYISSIDDSANLDLLEKNSTVESTESKFFIKEKKKLFYEICNSLPSIYSDTIIKFYIEGKSYEDISKEESTPIKTVASRLYRAKNLFKEKWRDALDETL